MRIRHTALLCALFAAAAAPAHALVFGVNIHEGGGSTSANTQVANIMKERNFKTARLDYFPGSGVSLLRDQVQKIKANGGHVELVTQISYQWDASCSTNLSGVEQDAYNQMYSAVNAMKDLVHDYELLNEVQLRDEIEREVGWNDIGTGTSAYSGKRCVATMTAVLRGMSRAVADIRASSGLPLRTILGVVGRDFGFLTYMQNQGVKFDVVGYHIYPEYGHAPLTSDTWYGSGGPLGQLARFGKPIRINEFNCGEVYQGGYENRMGASVTETCLKSLDKHLTYLRTQTTANVESITFYELQDAPAKSGAESRFGLTFGLNNPKVHLYLASAFAGGNLTAAERRELTSRGLLTDAEIDAMKSTSAPAPAPTPAPAPAPSPAPSPAPAPAPTPAPSPAPAPSTGRDRTAPSVSITSPWNNETLDRRERFTARVQASDNVGVREVRMTFNGDSCVAKTAPYRCTFTMPSGRNTRTSLSATATDTAGNTSRATITLRTGR